MTAGSGPGNGGAPAGDAGGSISTSEARALWRMERRTLRLGAFAATLLATGLALPHIFADAQGFRLALMLAALLVLAIATWQQLRIRCPRCGARLATQAAPLLPDRCRSCGIGIRHPASLADTELDV